MSLLDILKKTYKANVKCSNCSTFFECSIPKGVSINDFLDRGQAKCINCGCVTLGKFISTPRNVEIEKLKKESDEGFKELIEDKKKEKKIIKTW